MSMETDIRAKKNESKLKSLIEWGPVNTPTENFPKTSIRELAEKVDAMSGPQENDQEAIYETMRDMAKKLKRHNEVLVLMAEALEKFEEKLKKPSERRKPRKYKTKRKRAA